MQTIKFKTNRCEFDLKFEAIKQKWFDGSEIDSLRFYVGSLHLDYWKANNIELLINRIAKDQNAIPRVLKSRLEDLYFKQIK